MENNGGSTVSLARLESYDDFEALLAALRELLRPLGGMSAFVRPGQRVLLKVNLLAPARPEQAVTTHPELLRGVIRLVKEAGGIACVGDGPGVGDTLTNLKACGMAKVIEEEGAEALLFKETSVFENLENRIGKRVALSRHLLDCQVLISLPKLKTHVQMAYTGALKNQYGLIPGSAKGQYHFRFQNREHLADLMLDINRLAKPTLAIMDGIVAMEGEGPSGGQPRKLGALMASADLAALDVLACHLIGLDPERNPLNMAARRAGYGATRLEEINVCGERPENMRLLDFKLVKAPVNIMRILPLPAAWLRWLRRQVAPRPQINRELCIMCLRCAKGCPVQPAAIDPKMPPGKELNSMTCIRCYCCHEFCPVKAIDLKKSGLGRLLDFRNIADIGTRLLGKIVAFMRKR
ncbi:MAG: DUF362 domain-containing protein [Lentisphaerae bacterium]|nr:DUF362 domain-containing protein [Lentisphaerota bacterium]